MRIRQVRPEFWKDDVMADLGPEVRLFYIGLWCVADDAGWIEWNTAAIAAELFPYANRKVREGHVSKWSAALERVARIVRYDCGCVEIPHLAEHQRNGGNKITAAYDRHRIHTSTDKSVPSPDKSARANNANDTHTPTVLRGGVGGSGLPHITAPVETAWQEACGLALIGSGNFAITYIDDACRRHPEVEIVGAIVEARRGFPRIPTAQQLAAGVRAILDPLPSTQQSKQAELAAREKAEADASRRRSEATLRQTHGLGAHVKQANPRCPLCREDAA